MILSSHITVSASWKVSTEFVWVRYLQSSYIFTILSQSCSKLAPYCFCWVCLSYQTCILCLQTEGFFFVVLFFRAQNITPNFSAEIATKPISKPRFPRKASYVLFSLARCDMFLQRYWPLNQCDFGVTTLNWKRSIFSFFFLSIFKTFLLKMIFLILCSVETW